MLTCCNSLWYQCLGCFVVFGKLCFFSTLSILFWRNPTGKFLPSSYVFLLYTIAVNSFLALEIIISGSLLLLFDVPSGCTPCFLDKKNWIRYGICSWYRCSDRIISCNRCSDIILSWNRCSDLILSGRRFIDGILIWYRFSDSIISCNICSDIIMSGRKFCDRICS